ncbi:hypothetical protein [Bradyrhizobium sp. 1]|uniref:hypothetical protein n=1 Tax=Bradyrhizobium sp. 1 TaxID=241591 RepID=UPI001FFA3281|nr:hypothetical protein [Bradyrhizobium sp. 1]MCK1390797.1 hypothetical protein [Bradyrhizobium sp. 1]
MRYLMLLLILFASAARAEEAKPFSISDYPPACLPDSVFGLDCFWCMDEAPQELWPLLEDLPPAVS